MAGTIKLSNGASMPLIGIGTWLSMRGSAGKAVKCALEVGYRHVDCAHLYQNEDEIGEILAQCFQNGTVKREEVFIVSKLWCKDFAKEDVIPACELTLKNLGLDYVDLYLVHQPFRLEKTDGIKFPMPFSGEGVIGYSPELMKETWQQMELLLERGLCKAIGISNFTVKKIKDLLEFAKIKPVCNQIELHPYLPQDKVIKFCKENEIAVVAYSPLGSPGRPSILVKEEHHNLLADPVVVELAKKHGCTTAQVLLSWGMARGTPVIPKSVTPSRILENYEAIRVTLDEEDMVKLNNISIRQRYYDQCIFVKPGDTIENCWDNELYGED